MLSLPTPTELLLLACFLITLGFIVYVAAAGVM